MALPVSLLQAVSVPGGGRIALVVGAGCSFEEPTGIPLAGTCSEQSHARLVADGAIETGECKEPRNLSKLADLLYQKNGSQRLLVEQLRQHYALKTASPNEGHKLAIALLCEGALNSILTLNFDLAFSTAVGELGVGATIGVVDGPADFANQRPLSVFYLHRNANETDPEAWVLRTDALEREWVGGWEAVVAAKLIASPVVVFVGLGSPADVLVESSRKIRAGVPAGSQTFQVDPGDFGASPFAAALAIDESSFIKMKWSEFMFELSQRMVKAQMATLKEEADRFTDLNHLATENLDSLIANLEKAGLLELGKLRASWTLHPKLYRPDNDGVRGLLADLLLATALIARNLRSKVKIHSTGIVEFDISGRVATVILASGSGIRNVSAVEADLGVRLRQLRTLPAMPVLGVATGVLSHSPIAPPVDLVVDDQSSSIIYGNSQLRMFSADSLRADPNSIVELIV
ncbi:hypothetical protein SNE34_03855 [Lysobacter erysipheiresistens]|uniref:SIR2-like domain-containing protein n=1 Tax=Novilysobacter erysipheiresistens TaxID=1749332 RepID=A0ABU7YW29_9GAMM